MRLKVGKSLSSNEMTFNANLFELVFTPDSMQPKKRKMETLLPESVKNEESIDEIKKRAKLMAKPAESKKENEPECENCEL